MNFFKKIFKSNDIETIDGQWLDGYRNSEWHTAFSYHNKNGQLFKTDVSMESCFRIQKGVFSILRTIDPYDNNTFYMASRFLTGILCVVVILRSVIIIL